MMPPNEYMQKRMLDLVSKAPLFPIKPIAPILVRLLKRWCPSTVQYIQQEAINSIQKPKTMRIVKHQRLKLPTKPITYY